MTAMTVAQREKFLARPRMATFSYIGKDGGPVSVPVWFEWDGHAVRLNTSVTSPKLKYLRLDPRVCLVAGNALDEPEGWVAFYGEVRILEEGARELGERLMPRYWPISGDPIRDKRIAAYKEAFRAQEGIMNCFVLEFVPNKINAHWEFDDPGDSF